MKTSSQNSFSKFIKTGLAVVATLVLTAVITDAFTGGVLRAASSLNLISYLICQDALLLDCM